MASQTIETILTTRSTTRMEIYQIATKPKQNRQRPLSEKPISKKRKQYNIEAFKTNFNRGEAELRTTCDTTRSTKMNENSLECNSSTENYKSGNKAENMSRNSKPKFLLNS